MALVGRTLVGNLLVALALIASLGVPVLRLVHEAQHHAQQTGARASTVTLASIASDHDDTTCAICQLLSSAPGQAIEPLAPSVIAPPSIPVTLNAPPIGWGWAPGLSRQPPARGPPSSSLS